MPERKTLERAKADKRQGKSASTQAGEFVKEQMDHIRQGDHGARSTKQAIAIGLSEARRAGVALPPPKKGKASEKTRRNARSALAAGGGKLEASSPERPAGKRPSPTRSAASTKALKRESGEAASPEALSRQAKSAAQSRTKADRSEAARKAARTKGAAGRSAAAQKAARTRAANRAASQR